MWITTDAQKQSTGENCRPKLPQLICNLFTLAVYNLLCPSRVLILTSHRSDHTVLLSRTVTYAKFSIGGQSARFYLGILFRVLRRYTNLKYTHYFFNRKYFCMQAAFSDILEVSLNMFAETKRPDLTYLSMKACSQSQPFCSLPKSNY